MARPPAESSHPGAIVSVADPPWEYRLSASAAFIWSALQRLGLLPSPVQTPLAGPCTSLRALGTRGPARSLRGRALAWASHLLRRWLGLLYARYARFTGGVRAASGTTARLWLSRRPSARPVSCWHRPPHPTRGGTAEHARSGPRARGASHLAAWGRARRGPWIVFVCPPRLASPGGLARPAAGPS